MTTDWKKVREALDTVEDAEAAIVKKMEQSKIPHPTASIFKCYGGFVIQLRSTERVFLSNGRRNSQSTSAAWSNVDGVIADAAAFLARKAAR